MLFFFHHDVYTFFMHAPQHTFSFKSVQKQPSSVTLPRTIILIYPEPFLALYLFLTLSCSICWWYCIHNSSQSYIFDFPSFLIHCLFIYIMDSVYSLCMFFFDFNRWMVECLSHRWDEICINLFRILYYIYTVKWTYIAS